ncbi:arginine-glutamic acid dipeptide repeats protein [Acrasis kona]|uniref:Arginine-glutamic acid dipeptide repeats protein n=1 Tax=Acrasis kona TaxID=1008807 RepID=A0AAW2ZLU1_9EUKA
MCVMEALSKDETFATQFNDKKRRYISESEDIDNESFESPTKRMKEDIHLLPSSKTPSQIDWSHENNALSHESQLSLLSDICSLPQTSTAVATLPKLRKVTTKSADKDMDRGGALMWVPNTLKDSTIREYEEYCKSVVRKSLQCNSSKNDKKDRDARYLHDKALHILHQSKYDVGRAKSIVKENPSLITRGELCTYDEASKVKLGILHFGRDFSTIKRERLFDVNTSVGDLVNLYYLTKKRSPLLLIPPSLDTKLPVVLDDNDDDEQEEEQECNGGGDSTKQVNYVHSPNILDDEYSLELDEVPMSPLTLPSPSQHPLYYNNYTFSTDALNNEADAGFNDSASEEGSLSCDDFFVPIDCSSSCEATTPYDSDENSNVSYHDGDDTFSVLKVDDLFSLSNTL